MTREIYDYMPDHECSMDDAVERIKNMSNDNLVEIAYLMRKLLRHSIYDTTSGVMTLVGDFKSDYVDNDSLVVFSKLLSRNPYKSVEEVEEKLDSFIKSKGGNQ